MPSEKLFVHLSASLKTGSKHAGGGPHDSSGPSNKEMMEGLGLLDELLEIDRPKNPRNDGIKS